VNAWAAVDVTNPAEYFRVSIMSDNTGEPSMTDISSVETYDFSTTAEWHDFVFGVPAKISKYTKYWIVARSDASNQNGYAWSFDTANSYANGGLNPDETIETNVTWQGESATDDHWFKVYWSSATTIKFYDEDPDSGGLQIGPTPSSF